MNESVTYSNYRCRMRRTRAVAALSLLAVLLCAQTVSFITHEYPTAARFVFGDLDITAQINTIDVNGNEVAAADGESIGIAVAGYDRIVRATNSGSHPMWVRMRLTLDFIDASGTAHDISSVMSLSGGDDAWRRADDDFWYCTVPLEPGQTTDALCREMTVDVSEAAAAWGEGDVRLRAQVYGVQSEHNGESVFEAEGWPEL